jgi:hypothetical protein
MALEEWRSSDWLVRLVIVAFAVVLIAIIGGVAYNQISATKRCHDVGGRYVKEGYRYECIKGERVHP